MASRLRRGDAAGPAEWLLAFLVAAAAAAATAPAAAGESIAGFRGETT